MVRTPKNIPPEAAPAIARPEIKTLLFGAAAQIIDPAKNIVVTNTKQCLRENF
jgi:hypothetical protein